MKVQTKTYKSGLRLIASRLEDNRPVTIMFGVKTGSANEDKTNNGISHFIEHLNFKGTTNRTASQISKQLEGLGANANAFTGKYHTCFYATCTAESFEGCFEILYDIVFNSKYAQEDIDKERQVIFEEIDMYQDDPSSVAYEDFNRLFFKGTPLESSIIGTKDILNKIRREDIFAYIKKHYLLNNMVISIAGGIDFDKIDGFICKNFSKLTSGNSTPNLCDLSANGRILPHQTFNCIKKDIAQTHIIMGFPTDNIYSKFRTAYNILSFILGGGMSSRLFVKIREELGFVYSINALPDLYDIGGCIVISLATNAKNQIDAVKAIKAEIQNFVENGIVDEELNRAKTFCRTLLITSSETSVNIARHSANSLMIFNKERPLEVRLKEIESVSKQDVEYLIKQIFNFENMCLTLVSDKPNTEVFKCFN